MDSISDLRSLWKELDNYEVEFKKEAAELQEIWVKIAELKAICEAEHAQLDANPMFSFVDPETVIILNIGGQLFETTCEVLTRDPFSILAACCRINPIITPDIDSGHIFIDRDWWLFKHIITYLRSNVLPCELEILKELYTEASFYRLGSLQKSIEMIPMNQISSDSAMPATPWIIK